MPMNVVTDQDFAPRGMDAAADLLGRKAALTAEQLARLTAEHKRRAFAMAEVNNAKVIQQFRETIKRALKAGRPYREVRLEMLKILKTAGLDAPPIHRLRFLYQHHTLTSMSQAQTKFLKQDHVKRAFPYWQYKTVRSPGHRATHEAFADLVFAVDDSFWRYHDPHLGTGVQVLQGAAIPAVGGSQGDQGSELGLCAREARRAAGAGRLATGGSGGQARFERPGRRSESGFDQ